MAGVLGANDRIGVGFIGVGGRGSSHLATVDKLIKGGENLRIIAVCDAYRYRLDEAAKATGAKPYMKHAELLADPECGRRLHRHPGPTCTCRRRIDAIRAGKDVYCEKPMGHWRQFDLARQFYEETVKLKRVVQVGNQGNSSPAWQKVANWSRQGAIGRVQLVNAGFFRPAIGESACRSRTRMPSPDRTWIGRRSWATRRKCPSRSIASSVGGNTWTTPAAPAPICSRTCSPPSSAPSGLKFPSRAVASGGIFKYTTYDREVPDTFNMCLDYPEKLSVVLVSTLANDYVSEPAIRGDEGTLTLQNPGEWNVGIDSVTVVPTKGERQVFPCRRWTHRAHWKNFIHCVRTREKPVSDVQFGLWVQAALNMAMLSLLKDKVVKYDFADHDFLL